MTFRRSVFAAIVLVLGSAAAVAQTQVRFVEYSAKFLCGVSEGKEAGSAAVRPGVYETSINIHNPQLPLNPLPSVVFVKKLCWHYRKGKSLFLPQGSAGTPCRRILRSRLTARSSGTCWVRRAPPLSLKAFWCCTF